MNIGGDTAIKQKECERRFFVNIVILTALGVGGATVFGALLGFVMKGFSQRYGGLIMSFASGVMLASAMLGLILPSLELGGDFAPVVTIPAIFIGAIILDLGERLVPEGELPSSFETGDRRRGVIMFVFAIALHNLPEGMAAGVGFLTGDISDAMFIALGIAIQNLPEGMVLIAPMISAGISPGRAFFYAFLTGVIEVVGTFLGYFAARSVSVILPFALALAGGTMIYVISGDIMRCPDGEGTKYSGYSLLIGFSLMLIFNFILN